MAQGTWKRSRQYRRGHREPGQAAAGLLPCPPCAAASPVRAVLALVMLIVSLWGAGPTANAAAAPEPATVGHRAAGPGIAGPRAAGPLNETPSARARALTCPVEDIMARLTVEEKVGQLFMIHAYGLTADDTDPDAVARNRELHGVDRWRDVLAAYPVGGVIYFNYTNNVADPEQVARLSNDLQRIATGRRPGIPLLIAVDQEQGLVRRIGEPATEVPGAMALGAASSPVSAFDAAWITGRELRAMGINLNFAPVADVNVDPRNPVIGVRSFGDDPHRVAELVAAQVAGYRAAGIGAAAKHFPGHGNTHVDSHTGLPIIEHSLQQVQTVDLPPFRAAVGADVHAVMTAHIVVPSLDPTGRAATFSRPILTELLRGQLGYDGVIVTDALTMEGAKGALPPERVPVEIILAGADMLLMPPRLAEAVEAVLKAVREGEITGQRLNESVARIVRLKCELGLFDEAWVDEEHVMTVVGNEAHRARATAIADETITVIKDDAGLLPLGPGRFRRVLVTGRGETVTATLARLLEARGFDATALPTGRDPEPGAAARAVEAAAAHDLVLVTTMNVTADSPQQALLEALLSTGTPVVAVAVRNPYDVAAAPGVPTYVATYGERDVSLRALVRVLLGDVSPTGRLPVAVPAADGSGRTLFPRGHGMGYRRDGSAGS